MRKSFSALAAGLLLASLCGCGHQPDGNPTAVAHNQTQDALGALESLTPAQRPMYMKTHPELAKMIQDSKDPALKQKFDALMQQP